MDQGTQQNATLVEQAAAASQAMLDQAQRLAEVASIFRLAGLQEAGQPVQAVLDQRAAPARIAAPARR